MTTATPGRCQCGTRIIRADIHGVTVTVGVYQIDAATELTEWAAGRVTYSLYLDREHRLELEPRTPDDIRRKPVGFTRTQIVQAHKCGGP